MKKIFIVSQLFFVILLFIIGCNSTKETNVTNLPISLWAEPDDGGATVVEAIENAKISVDITIYEIGGPYILNALKTAKLNNVNIRIIANGQFFVGPYPENFRYYQTYRMIEFLKYAPGGGSVEFHWASNNFNITHQKTIIIDARSNEGLSTIESLPKSAKALIMTLNLSAYGWPYDCAYPCQFWGNGQGTRDFGAVVYDPDLVIEIAKVFESDFNCEPSYITNNLKNSNNDLVWSNGTTGLPGFEKGFYPTDGAYPIYKPSALGNSVDQGNARQVHLDIINNAKDTLIIYNEEMNDDEIVDAIVNAALKSVNVRVIMTGTLVHNKYYQYYWNFNKLYNAGAQIRLFPNNSDFMYIHAKVILADFKTDSAIAYMGSQNISGNSLNFNRELGIILTGIKNTKLFIDTFEKDWITTGLINWPPDSASDDVTEIESESNENSDESPMTCGLIQ